MYVHGRYADTTKLMALKKNVHEDHYCLRLLCEAIVDCKLLIRLLNLLDPSLHLNEQMNTEDRLNTFVRHATSRWALWSSIVIY